MKAKVPEFPQTSTHRDPERTPSPHGLVLRDRPRDGMVSGSKRATVSAGEPSDPTGVCSRRRAGGAAAPSASMRRPRKVYEASFKLMVVQEALKLPASNRIKPTCRAYPGVEPVQVRKWIRNLAALQLAQPTAKLVQRVRPCPDLATDESSETESVESTPQPVELLITRPRLHGASRHRGAGRAKGRVSPARDAPLLSDGSESSGRSVSPTSLYEAALVTQQEAPHVQHVPETDETLRVARELLKLSSSCDETEA